MTREERPRIVESWRGEGVLALTSSFFEVAASYEAEIAELKHGLVTLNEGHTALEERENKLEAEIERLREALGNVLAMIDEVTDPLCESWMPSPSAEQEIANARAALQTEEETAAFPDPQPVKCQWCGEEFPSVFHINANHKDCPRADDWWKQRHRPDGSRI